MIKGKFLKKIFFAVISLILLVIILFFAFRNIILDQVIAKAVVKIERDFDAKLSIKDANFSGLSTLHFDEISLKPNKADTLVHFKNVTTSVNLFKIAFKDLQLGNLEINGGLVQLVQKDSIKNFAAFLNRKSPNETKQVSERNYAEIANRLVTNLLDLVPTSMDVNRVTFKINDEGKEATILIKDLSLQNKKLQTNVHVITRTFTQDWVIDGLADPRNNKADLSIRNAQNAAVKIPYFDERFNLVGSFKTINFKLDELSSGRNKFGMNGSMTFDQFHLNHPKIASKDVAFDYVKVDYSVEIGKDYFTLLETSKVAFNKINFQPTFEIKTETDTIFKFNVKIPKMSAQDFISSLPDGLFTNFQGMEAEGSFAYELNFNFNINKPDDIILDSKLEKHEFKIVKYGAANLSKLNTEFTYRAFENGQYQRPIVVGTSNPNFTPLDAISPYLKNSVLTTEDPSFFHHKGFIEEAFKQSIVQNIKTKKFSRGGSTISMQLVKNVFLTREKTLSRKLEEILLVYILENNRISSKSRMLEVYFNVIEWGPNVYGIGEASQFYFQKSPSELSLNESIYLATIVPSPKRFMRKFDTEGNLRSSAFQKQYYLTNLMMRRGLLAEADTIFKRDTLKVIGNARNFMIITPKDTLEVEEEIFDLNLE